MAEEFKKIPEHIRIPEVLVDVRVTSDDAKRLRKASIAIKEIDPRGARKL
jgi:hypothetical protein